MIYCSIPCVNFKTYDIKSTPIILELAGTRGLLFLIYTNVVWNIPMFPLLETG